MPSSCLRDLTTSGPKTTLEEILFLVLCKCLYVFVFALGTSDAITPFSMWLSIDLSHSQLTVCGFVIRHRRCVLCRIGVIARWFWLISTIGHSFSGTPPRSVERQQQTSTKYWATQWPFQRGHLLISLVAVCVNVVVNFYSRRLSDEKKEHSSKSLYAFMHLIEATLITFTRYNTRTDKNININKQMNTRIY